jgi:hypothetical protein
MLVAGRENGKKWFLLVGPVVVDAVPVAAGVRRALVDVDFAVGAVESGVAVTPVVVHFINVFRA